MSVFGEIGAVDRCRGAVRVSHNGKHHGERSAIGMRHARMESDVVRDHFDSDTPFQVRPHRVALGYLPACLPYRAQGAQFLLSGAPLLDGADRHGAHDLVDLGRRALEVPAEDMLQ